MVKLKPHKDKAWNAFSLFIRTRDSLKTTGGLDECICVTCARRYPRLGVGCIQAGHFIGGRTNSVLFSEKGVHGQCGACNNGVYARNNKSGIAYYQFMEKTYGRETIDRLILESNQTVIYKAWQYDEIREKYKNKLVQLLAGKSIDDISDPVIM